MAHKAVTAKKSLGQHFIQCPWVLTAIADSAHLTKSDTVLEIGPGTGLLTRVLAKRAGQVVAVEKDEVLAAATAQQLKDEGMLNVRIIAGDILKMLASLSSYTKVAANIPYYLTGRLIRMLLEAEHLPKSMSLTIQKEVAERIVAQPPDMSLLSLSVQLRATPHIVAFVPALCFSPVPKVDSAVIALTDISREKFALHTIRPEDVFSLARPAFGQRRKMLVNGLTATGIEKKDAETLLKEAGISPAMRPEELSVENWITLAHARRSVR